MRFYLLFVSVLLSVFISTSAQYCASFNSGGSACITNVSINTLNNTTPGCASGNYSSQSATTNLIINNTYNLSVSLSTIGNASVWIDFNHNQTFEPSEWYQVIASGTTGTISITIPASSGFGAFGMRVRSAITAYPIGATDACNTIFTGETEDYTITVLPGVNYDPAIVHVTIPSGNCFSSSSTIAVQVTNYGLLPINLNSNPVTVYLYVLTPNGPITYSTVLSTGMLPCCGANALNVLIPNVNLYSGGMYTVNTALSIVTSGGVNNPILNDDSLSPPLTFENKRPTPNPPYQLCQGAAIPFGQGLGVTGCSLPLSGTATITFTVTPCMDNVGATAPGSNIGLPSNCANQYACTFASGVLPALPPGAFFSQPGILTITNLYSAFPDECRFNLFGAIPNGVSLYSACPTPYNVGANDINVGGMTVGAQANFSYTRKIATSSLSAMYSNLQPGDIVHVGYFETWNDTAFQADCLANAQNIPTVVTLTIPYSYIPASIEWYDVPSGGTSLYNLSPFNPLLTPNAVVTNSNTTGTYVFYAACSGTSACRTPDTLIILPSPLALQDSMAMCENLVSSNTAVFDLTTLNSGISGGNPYDSIRFFYDMALVSQIATPTTDTTGSTILYSKMYLGSCYSSDSVIVEVHSLPDVQMVSQNGSICVPNSIDVNSLINPFSTFPTGSDTLFFQDAACMIPYPNPHAISISDSIYIVAITNTIPACSDTNAALVILSGADSLLVNQTSFNISECSAISPVNAVSHVLGDGDSKEYQSVTDCRRIAHITDVLNGLGLGATTVEEEIACTTPTYLGQPYLKRHFKVTATNETSANLCLYFLQDDVDEFNADAISAGQQVFLPNLSNLCVTKIDNGDLLDPLHTYTVIGNNLINVWYDTARTIWSACFPVDSFSSFYCHTCNALNVALPTDLLQFEAKKNNHAVNLSWQVNQETPIAYYVVERSTDGHQFFPISANIPYAAGAIQTTNQRYYQYNDVFPVIGHNYYRLAQFDLDGKKQVSTMRDLLFYDGYTVQVFPNPIDDIMHLRVYSDKPMANYWEIKDLSGRSLKKGLFNVDTGWNTVDIDASHLSAGLYTISLYHKQQLLWVEKINKKG